MRLQADSCATSSGLVYDLLRNTHESPYGPFRESEIADFESRIPEWLDNGWELLGPVSCCVHRARRDGEELEDVVFFATLIKR